MSRQMSWEKIDVASEDSGEDIICAEVEAAVMAALTRPNLTIYDGPVPDGPPAVPYVVCEDFPDPSKTVVK